ncbi:hypothetical protein DTO013E5_5627 [Penicillium roqueforti]|uniref:uncharacterized protein n=1 Tax=Penicillium roqueforti TaxID=5082 RepID=UPI00190E2840|nr:uncharacterized protein LCP9604111_8697 [Penicillium roqueforti]KAF9240522.1 hypothetical protein LCP9604111_8697 [Penicillium roqueforti]KAI1830784.1 hypothetical protein CBS147337_8401 [Penicillium roqueforti]KAI2674468.1 hypothetical protein CBS147355_7082 [Penicillium roqueforti]KAI2683872.1 hypothetical protein LCP963914a_5702 [Penicillium roqueforti]KAI2696806.1 hypothetical protein CBS147372_8225 [Penicillium roqueforti]
MRLAGTHAITDANDIVPDISLGILSRPKRFGSLTLHGNSYLSRIAKSRVKFASLELSQYQLNIKVIIVTVREQHPVS